MNESDAVTALAALAQPMRLQVFRRLVVAGPEGQTPGALCEALNVPAPTLSFHLKELLHAQLLTQEREGRHLIYRARFAHMNALLAYLTDHCCQGSDCGTPAPACCPASP